MATVSSVETINEVISTLIMCKSVIGRCIFGLFFCAVSLSAQVKNYTIKVNGVKVKYTYSPEKVSWEEARARCWASGAQLLVPQVEAEARRVSRLRTWTGINDLDYTGVYRAPDGLPLNSVRLNWGKGQPDPYYGERRCVKIYHTLLYLSHCNSLFPYVCKFPTPTTPSSQCDAANKICDKTFTLFINGEENTYEFHHEHVTYHQARERCAGAGAQLLVPGDETEARALRGDDRVFPGVSIWVGIDDLNKRGDYRTPDGRTINSVHHRWGPDEPRQRGSKYRCVMLQPDSSLHVRYCGRTFPYVCKFHLTPPVTATTPRYCEEANELCERRFRIKTYNMDVTYVFHPEHVTWHQARERCAGAGGRLLVAEDEAEAGTVRGEGRVDPRVAIWVGINDLDRAGVYRTLDGRPLKAVHHLWDNGRPNLENIAWHCVMMLPDSSLQAHYCGLTGPYVCKFGEFPSANERADRVLSSKPYNSTTHNKLDTTFTIIPYGVKYEFHHEYVTWHQARERCAGAGAQLMVPENAWEARAVRGEDRVKPGVAVWVGIDDLNYEGDYRTQDGRRISAVYNEWYAGKPEPHGRGWHCVKLLPDSSLHLDYCGWTYPYVCKFYTSTPKPYCEDNDTDGACENTFRAKIDGAYFKYVYHYDLATWHQAREGCAGGGAQLWSPDEAEAKTVMRELSRYVSGLKIWTGFQDLDKGGVYRALDGRPLSAVQHRWHGGHPNWDGVAWHCVTVLPDASLTANYCGQLFNYVCKFP